MKYGDKVVCIEDYVFCGNRYNIKNKTYTLISTDSSIYPMSTDISIYAIYINSESGGYCVFSDLEFKTHFIILKEIRKQKINKINK